MNRLSRRHAILEVVECKVGRRFPFGDNLSLVFSLRACTGQKLLQGMPALRLWTNWRNRQTGLPNQLAPCETRECTGESCSNWGGADGHEMLSVCAAAEVS